MNKIVKCIITFSVFFFTANCLSAQYCLNDIDLKKVPQQEIRELLAQQQRENFLCIKDIESTCAQNANLSNYFKQVRTYNVNNNIEKVWQSYYYDSPINVYNTKKFSFGLMLCKNKNQKNIMYSDDNFGNIEKGQIIYLKLKFLKGLYKMAVAFEILDVDSINKTIEFSYVKGANKSNGKQKLQFFDCKNGNTKIVHTSYYKSNFMMRDRILYPFFHAKVTNSFHNNLRKIIAFKNKKLNKTVSVQ